MSDFMTTEPSTDSTHPDEFLTEICRLRSQIAAKQQLLNVVCHELRGPLHLARLCLGSALSAAELTPQCREELRLADTSLGRAAGMAKDLLDATRIDHDVLAVAVRATDVGAAVADVVAGGQRIARHFGRRLVASVPEDLPPVLADPDRLRQVVGNLIDNALKFSPRGSTVRVVVAPAADVPAFVEIAVEDEGHGVDLANAERLFERFHQAPSPHSKMGIGLGLYLCRELVRRQGGDIWVENRPEGGARFAFTLPVGDAEEALAKAS